MFDERHAIVNTALRVKPAMAFGAVAARRSPLQTGSGLPLGQAAIFIARCGLPSSFLGGISHHK